VLGMERTWWAPAEEVHVAPHYFRDVCQGHSMVALAAHPGLRLSRQLTGRGPSDCPGKYRLPDNFLPMNLEWAGIGHADCPDSASGRTERPRLTSPGTGRSAASERDWTTDAGCSRAMLTLSAMPWVRSCANHLGSRLW
jgi:hypothetical protein